MMVDGVARIAYKRIKAGFPRLGRTGNPVHEQAGEPGQEEVR